MECVTFDIINVVLSGVIFGVSQPATWNRIIENETETHNQPNDIKCLARAQIT